MKEDELTEEEKAVHPDYEKDEDYCLRCLGIGGNGVLDFGLDAGSEYKLKEKE